MLAAIEDIAGHDKKRVTSVIMKYIGQGGRMTAEVDDGFFQLFERRIFVRGEAYYAAGKVDPPVMIAENLWHTVVRGNDDYQVDIRLRHGKVISRLHMPIFPTCNVLQACGCGAYLHA